MTVWTLRVASTASAIQATELVNSSLTSVWTLMSVWKGSLTATDVGTQRAGKLRHLLWTDVQTQTTGRLRGLPFELKYKHKRQLSWDTFPFEPIGSLRWDDGYARERQAEVKHKNAWLPSVFIHPSNLGGNCKTTLVSSHRKRSLLFIYFPVGNLVCQLFARFISRIPFYTTQLIS